MKKIVLAAVVGIVVLAAAVVWLFPPLTYDLAPFLWRSHHQERIKQRTRTLLEHLGHGNTEGAIELTEPAYVRRHGTNAVGLRFEVLGAIVRLAGTDNLRVEEVVLGPDTRTAEVKLSHRRGGEWKPIPPSRWVRVGGEWYVTF